MQPIYRPGLAIEAACPGGFRFGPGVFGPEPEFRALASIRASLLEPHCDGPDPVYGIAMDVGRLEHRDELRHRMLLFGVVAYAAGSLGREPVRSQGHVHRVARHSGSSPPEIFEVWSGRALIYLQEFAGDDPGRCYAIDALPGDRVVAPPGWAHAVISADPAAPLVFGAWCDREYGFEYDAVRARGGLAWFPLLKGSEVAWRANPRYRERRLQVRRARKYPELGIVEGLPLYLHFERDPESVQWVSKPLLRAEVWKEFEP